MLGKFFAALQTHGLFEGSLIAMMADHGEAFGEHGERTHGIFLYDETIHVPLMIKLPGGRNAGTRMESRAGLVDVMPTVLEAVGVTVPKEVQGRSLLGVLEPPLPDSPPSGQNADRPIYSETDYPHRAFKWSSLRSLRTGKYLFIEAPQPELYDQTLDPKAEKNLADSSRAVADTLSAQTESFRKATAADLAIAAKLDPEQAEKLRALGYASGDNSVIREGKVGGTDPKQRIEIANLMHDGMMQVEQGRYEEAISGLQRVIEVEPNTAIAYVQLGTAYTRMKQYEKALPALRKAVELKADSGLAQYELGLALFETGNWNEAAPQFEQVIARMPRWADAQFSLASVYARIDRVPEGMEHLDTCLNLNPAHYRANLLRGRILSLQGKPADALPNLKKAIEVQPDSREAHLFLADAYEQLGDSVKAARERAQAGQR
jgi:tetratricopeptide (TPR) repeat protein